MHELHFSLGPHSPPVDSTLIIFKVREWPRNEASKLHPRAQSRLFVLRSQRAVRRADGRRLIAQDERMVHRKQHDEVYVCGQDHICRRVRGDTVATEQNENGEPSNGANCACGRRLLSVRSRASIFIAKYSHTAFRILHLATVRQLLCATLSRATVES